MLNPEQTFHAFLKEDAETHEATRPVLIVKGMTAREARTYRSIIKTASDLDTAGDLDASLDKLQEAIGSVFKGVVNIPNVTTAADLENVFSVEQLWELSARIPMASSLKKAPPAVSA